MKYFALPDHSYGFLDAWLCFDASLNFASLLGSFVHNFTYCFIFGKCFSHFDSLFHFDFQGCRGKLYTFISNPRLKNT